LLKCETQSVEPHTHIYIYIVEAHNNDLMGIAGLQLCRLLLYICSRYNLSNSIQSTCKLTIFTHAHTHTHTHTNVARVIYAYTNACTADKPWIILLFENIAFVDGRRLNVFQNVTFRHRKKYRRNRRTSTYTCAAIYYIQYYEYAAIFLTYTVYTMTYSDNIFNERGYV